MSVREDCVAVIIHVSWVHAFWYILYTYIEGRSWLLFGGWIRRSCMAVGNYCVLHVWMLHVTWRPNESRHTRMRVLMSRMWMFESCQTCVTPHSDARGALNTSSQIWMNHVTYECVMCVCVMCVCHVTYECVMSHVNASCYMWMSHGTHEWDTAHIDEWYRICGGFD